MKTGCIIQNPFAILGSLCLGKLFVFPMCSPVAENGSIRYFVVNMKSKDTSRCYQIADESANRFLDQLEAKIKPIDMRARVFPAFGVVPTLKLLRIVISCLHCLRLLTLVRVIALGGVYDTRFKNASLALITNRNAF